MSQLRTAEDRSRSPLLAVWVNGVKVGTVTEGEYVQMRQAVRRDPRNAWAQALNLSHVLAAIGWRSVLGAPLALFWLVAGMAMLAPAELGRTIREFSGSLSGAAASDVIVCTVQSAVVASGVVAALGVLVLAGISNAALGFKDCYAAALDRMLRLRCASPAEGRITVRRAIATCGDAAVLVL